MTVGELGLRDQPLIDTVEAQQAGDQVVAGQKRVVAGGGHVVMWMMFVTESILEPAGCRIIG